MKRIQRKRTKGWKMPENAVYVGRPSKWGNPFKVWDGFMMYHKEHKLIGDPWCFWDDKRLFTNEGAITLYRLWIEGKLRDDYYGNILPNIPDIEELRGKDLACWCPLDKPCHADVLIKLLS